VVVVPDDLRQAIAEHARAEAPNEACGLLAFRDGVAERYLPAINEAASPYRFTLKPRNPLDFFLEDEGFELAVVHSHPAEAPTGARPSRTDIENIGLWEGRPYLIYSEADGALRAWRVCRDRVDEIELAD
jgi:[CysO sulfur-carrier protein]-S-L-cysteine hydrolase